MHMNVNGVINVFLASVMSGMRGRKISTITSVLAVQTVLQKIKQTRIGLESRLITDPSLSTLEKENIATDIEAIKNWQLHGRDAKNVRTHIPFSKKKNI